MIGAGGARWAVSLADLLALLLGFFVLASADALTRDRAVSGVAAALGSEARPSPAYMLKPARFFPDEARLTPAGNAEIAKLARRWRAGQGGITVIARGRPADTRRFDGWELAAARAAAVARALRAGGIAESRVAISVDTVPAGDDDGIAIRRTR